MTPTRRHDGGAARCEKARPSARIKVRSCETDPEPSVATIMTHNGTAADRAQRPSISPRRQLDIRYLPADRSLFRARLSIVSRRACSHRSPPSFAGILSFRRNLSVLEIDISRALHLSHRVFFSPRERVM